MNTVMDKDIKQVLKAIKTKSLITQVENFIVALKMMGYEINPRIGTWDYKTKTIEYALLVNDTDYRMEYIRNKISFIFEEKQFKMFIVRLENQFFNIRNLWNLIEENEEVQLLSDHNKHNEFILNCTNKKLVGDIIKKLLSCAKSH